MSGGSMDYLFLKVKSVLAHHETLFGLTDSSGNVSSAREEFRTRLAATHKLLESTARMLKAVEWEDSGDSGPVSTEEAWEQYKRETET